MRKPRQSKDNQWQHDVPEPVGPSLPAPPYLSVFLAVLLNLFLSLCLCLLRSRSLSLSLVFPLSQGFIDPGLVLAITHSRLRCKFVSAMS